MLEHLDIQNIGDLRIIFRPNSNDRKIIREILMADSYFLKKFKTNENIRVIDIGSHIGIFSLGIKKHCPNANVIGYELDEENYILSLINNGLNNLDIKFYNLAVTPSNIKPVSRLYHNHRNKGSYCLLYNGEAQTNVNTIEIDRILKDKCDILKMDIEGGEFPILENIDLEWLANQVNYFMIEFHDDFESKTKYKPLKYKSSVDAINDLIKHFKILAYNKYTDLLSVLVFKSRRYRNEENE